MGQKEKCVHIGQDTVTNGHGCARGFSHTGPDVGFLRDGGQGVVITVEREEPWSWLAVKRPGGSGIGRTR